MSMAYVCYPCPSKSHSFLQVDFNFLYSFEFALEPLANVGLTATCFTVFCIKPIFAVQIKLFAVTEPLKIINYLYNN